MKPAMWRPVEPRFQRGINKDGPIPAHRPDLGPCWLWTRTLNSNGYGVMSVEGRRRYVHRVAYELFIGPIPDGLEPDHLCRVRRCANPGHLELVTHRENILRGDSPAGAQARQVVCARGHDLVAGDFYVTKTGRRQCRDCRRERRKAGAK